MLVDVVRPIVSWIHQCRRNVGVRREFEDLLLVAATRLGCLGYCWIIEVRRHQIRSVGHVIVGHEVVHVLILLEVILNPGAICVFDGWPGNMVRVDDLAFEDIRLFWLLHRY